MIHMVSVVVEHSCASYRALPAVLFVPFRDEHLGRGHLIQRQVQRGFDLGAWWISCRSCDVKYQLTAAQCTQLREFDDLLMDEQKANIPIEVAPVASRKAGVAESGGPTPPAPPRPEGIISVPGHEQELVRETAEPVPPGAADESAEDKPAGGEAPKV